MVKINSKKRIQFLNSFLKVLGAKNIKYSKIDFDRIYGTVFTVTNSGELQDFCWHIQEEDVPSERTIEVLNILHDNKFVDIDKITVPFEEIFLKTTNMNLEQFNQTMNEILCVQVRMVDDGEETDSYFLHG